MSIDWKKQIHAGWRRSLGVFLIVFGLAAAGLYALELKAAAQQTSQSNVKRPEASVAQPTLSSPQPTPLVTESPAQSGKIKLSTATQAELESLPGIGPAKATAIIQYREQYGFKSIDELDEVKGIGPKTLEQLRPLLEL